MFKKISKLLGSLGIITLGALLGAWGGQEKRWLRRFFYPAILVIYAYYIIQDWKVLAIYSISGWLSIGYGLPSYLENPNHPNYDEGSTLGRFFYKLFKGNELWANIFSRGVIGILITISLLSFPIITHKWLSYILMSIIIILIWALNSHRGYGSIPVKLFGKTINLLTVDLVTYGVTTAAILGVVHGIFG